MDEAGSGVTPQLSFWLGWNALSLLPAPSPPLRNLTLGVLIVSGGTLASLPFRRYPTGDASMVPPAVTGPAQSELDPSVLSAPIEADPAVFASLDSLPSWVPPSVPPRSRQLDIPLTYEDLAMPIDQPAVIENRFNATARVYQKQNPQNHASPLLMPEMDSLAMQQEGSNPMFSPSTNSNVASNQPVYGALGPGATSPNAMAPNVSGSVTMGPSMAQLGPAAQPQASDRRSGTAGGFLASSQPSQPTFQPLPEPTVQPEPTQPARQHHWIRQP